MLPYVALAPGLVPGCGPSLVGEVVEHVLSLHWGGWGEAWGGWWARPNHPVGECLSLMDRWPGAAGIGRMVGQAGGWCGGVAACGVWVGGGLWGFCPLFWVCSLAFGSAER
ncbi:hypothetical protein CRENBAI_018496 [Crenichthys baileyi]|uniref:Secreted protein n=1 Tax=Crenichthys baileyi TaxID=28760 RepID=A0AAV9RY19_9TELE